MHPYTSVYVIQGELLGNRKITPKRKVALIFNCSYKHNSVKNAAA